MVVAAKTLFKMEDRVLKQTRLYALWTSIFISNCAVLLSDDTQGASRDFNAWANGISVLYCGMSSANNIFGNGLPSTMLLTVGPIHQYAFWHLFAYYGGDAVLGQHPIGVMNWVTCFIVGLFSVDMIVKTWYITAYPTEYAHYVQSGVDVGGNIEDGGGGISPATYQPRPTLLVPEAASATADNAGDVNGRTN
jgi:hypothetical protein